MSEELRPTCPTEKVHQLNELIDDFIALAKEKNQKELAEYFSKKKSDFIMQEVLEIPIYDEATIDSMITLMKEFIKII